MTVTRTPDLCDRCGARAKMRAQLHSGELFFCAHHGRQHGEALWREGADTENIEATVPSDRRAART